MSVTLWAAAAAGTTKSCFCASSLSLLTAGSNGLRAKLSAGSPRLHPAGILLCSHFTENRNQEILLKLMWCPLLGISCRSHRLFGVMSSQLCFSGLLPETVNSLVTSVSYGPVFILLIAVSALCFKELIVLSLIDFSSFFPFTFLRHIDCVCVSAYVYTHICRHAHTCKHACIYIYMCTHTPHTHQYPAAFSHKNSCLG